MAGESQIDPRKLMTGKDGKMYVKVNGVSEFLAEVDTFQVQMNVTNVDYQPVGSMLSYAVTTGVNFTLTFTEAIIRDNLLMKPILDAIQEGNIVTYEFKGELYRDQDGQSEEILFENCIPDGTFDIMNLTPGEIIKRQNSFRINSVPKVEKFLNENSVSS